MIDPQERWARYGEKPDYSGLLTFAGMPYTEDPAELEGFDVAVVGAPMDDLVSDRPGARLAPRAIRGASSPPGPHLEVGIDAFAELRVVDFGDAPVIPADPVTSHAAIEATVGQVLAAGVMPVVLGGDHSITEPSMRACAGAHGPGRARPLRHPHGHRRGGVRRRVLARHVHPPPRRPGPPRRRAATPRSACAATGPGRRSSAGRPSTGSRACSCTTSATSASARWSRRAIAAVGPGPTYLTVDVDVLDPAFIPGTGTPEPGGMTAVDLLLAVRTVAAELDLIGADVVEVIPTSVGTDDYSALVAERVIREALTGIALRRRDRLTR